MTARGKRMLRWIGLLVLLGASCAPVRHRKDRVVITGDGFYSDAVDANYGCEGELLERQRHRQLGGGAAAHLEYANGVTGGARLRLASSALRSYEGGDVDPDDDAHGLGALGLHVGYDFRHVGASLGVSGVTLLDFDDALLVPYGQLRVGLLERSWIEVTAGTTDPLFFTNVLGLGLGVRSQQTVRFRLGLTLFGKFLRDATEHTDADGRDQGPLAFGYDEQSDLGAYLDLRVLTSDRGWGLDLGALIANEPSVRLGLSYSFIGP